MHMINAFLQLKYPILHYINSVQACMYMCITLYSTVKGVASLVSLSFSPSSSSTQFTTWAFTFLCLPLIYNSSYTSPKSPPPHHYCLFFLPLSSFWCSMFSSSVDNLASPLATGESSLFSSCGCGCWLKTSSYRKVHSNTTQDTSEQ